MLVKFTLLIGFSELSEPDDFLLQEWHVAT